MQFTFWVNTKRLLSTFNKTTAGFLIHYSSPIILGKPVVLEGWLFIKPKKWKILLKYTQWKPTWSEYFKLAGLVNQYGQGWFKCPESPVVTMNIYKYSFRFHLVAHDWGGIVSYSFAAKHPNMLKVTKFII